MFLLLWTVGFLCGSLLLIQIELVGKTSLNFLANLRMCFFLLTPKMFLVLVTPICKCFSVDHITHGVSLVDYNDIHRLRIWPTSEHCIPGIE